MENWKTILGVFLASIVLVVLMAVGLSKMSATGQGAAKVDETQLEQDARWVKITGEAKVTVVEFSDIQCPACKQAEPVGVELRKMDGVKFVYRHFPLITIHKNSWKGARALEAVHLINTDKGWEMMTTMFDNQEKWAEESNPDSLFTDYAKSIGIDEKEFNDKYKSDETDKLVGVDSNLGSKIKLTGTPTFFVNGEQIAAPAVLDKVRGLLK